MMNRLNFQFQTSPVPVRFSGSPEETASSAPPAATESFSRLEALNLLSEGQIGEFNRRLNAWRQENPTRYFDLTKVNFTHLLKGREFRDTLALNGDDPTETHCIDFRGVNLSGADFRGVKVLNAMMSVEPGDFPDLDPAINPLQGTKFSLSAAKIMT